MTQHAVLRLHRPPPRDFPVKPVPNSFSAPWPTPERPPADWLDKPSWMAAGTRLTVDNDGRVYGYLVPWSPVPLPSGETFTAQRSPSRYTRAMQGTVVTDDGAAVRCAVLGARGHPDDAADYVDPTTARAVVRFGEDAHGVWCAGALVPGVTYGDVAEMRRCSLSVDYRDGDLVGVGIVNVPAAPHGVELHDVIEPVELPPETRAAAVASPEIEPVDIASLTAAAHRQGRREGLDLVDARVASLIVTLRQQVDLLELRATVDACDLRRDARVAAVWDHPQGTWLGKNAEGMRAAIDDAELSYLGSVAALVELPPVEPTT